MENLSSLINAIIMVPLLGVLFASLSKEDNQSSISNVICVGIFTIFSNLVVLWRTALLVDVEKGNWQIVEKFSWLDSPKIELILGVDIFSLMLITAVHIAVLLGIVGIRHNLYRQKTLIVFALMFLSMISGYFLSYDLFSFYIFFEAMLLPLFMLIGIFGDIKKQTVLYRFFLYNLLGAVFLLIALVILHNSQCLTVSDIAQAKLSAHWEILVWCSIVIAFISRIPIWPFHYWITSVSANVSNPLVFVITNIMPLSGVYGLVRFFPLNTPESLAPFLLVLEIISIITMLIISLIGFSKKDIQYKIFAYTTVYYIMYLLGALLPTDALLLNIGFSLFAYLIIMAALEIMVSYIDTQCQAKDVTARGVLCNMRRASVVFSFLILAAIGMPLSSLFLNNMVIFAGLLKYNIQMAVCILLAIILSSLGLIQQLFYLKYPKGQAPITAVPDDDTAVIDISVRFTFMMMLIAGLLILSFINPLWFLG